MAMIKDQKNKKYSPNGNGLYNHQTKGRLRRAVHGLQYSYGFADQLETEIEQTKGVNRVETNIVTGRILILFDHKILTHDELASILDGMQLRNGNGKYISGKDVKKRSGKKAKNRAINKEHEHRSIDGSEPSIKRHIIQLCITGAILVFLFIKRRFMGGGSLSRNGSLLGLGAITTIIAGYPIFRNGLGALSKREQMNIDTLITVATIATIVLRESLTGLVVVWLIDFSNLLQLITMRRSRKAFEDLLSLDEEAAWRLVDEVEVKVLVQDVCVNDIVVAHIGEKIVVDGEVVKGEAAVNQAAITGESNLVAKQAGDRTFAGTIVEIGTLYIRAEKVGDDTQLARIIQVVEEAQGSRAEIQNFADRFAQKVIPVSFILSVLTFLVTWDIRRSLTMLVIACPCAVGLSTPTAVVAAIGGAARKGILIKGGTHLETAGKVDTVIFDKTGTLTEGKPKVTRVISLSSQFKPKDILMFAAIGVKHSSHPLAAAVLVYVHEMEAIVPEHSECEAIIGHGVRAISDGIQIVVGSGHFMSDMGIKIDFESEIRAKQLAKNGESVLYVARDGGLIGVIGVKDSLRPGIDQALMDLRKNGINKIYLVTGDHYDSAAIMAKDLDIDEIKASMMPEDKSDFVKMLQIEGRRVAVVGDGINDGPALAVADLGIAMKTNGTDVAIEAADVAITGDQLNSVSEVMRISKRAMKTIHQNFVFSIGINSLGILLGTFGLIAPLTAAIMHNASTLGVVFNSSRLYMIKKDTAKGKGRNKWKTDN